ncbi:hypothetical protein MSG28_001746 [Choristoneura fumiferana]|uniref:Uncharacterized protein n=1 Tax=Choristoneura fumiferana TaxID=7141 RepID=A0ACC0KW94_CHOFU|nr:hypothetical protein MSG28_001746 [Choristoneura fumiferana]
MKSSYLKSSMDPTFRANSNVGKGLGCRSSWTFNGSMHTKSHVSTSLVQKAGQPAICHMELCQAMTWGQSHFAKIRRIPGTHQHSSISRIIRSYSSIKSRKENVYFLSKSAESPESTSSSTGRARQNFDIDIDSDRTVEEERLLLERSMAEAKKTLASEIPRAPSSFEDWVKFKEQTGIDIDIDFNERLNDGDATRAIERLESIERETLERLKQEAEMKEETYSCKSGGDIASVASFEVSSDCDVWTRLGDGPMADPRLEVDVLFKNLMTTTVESKH